MKRYVVAITGSIGIALVALMWFTWTPAPSFNRQAIIDDTNQYSARIIRDKFGSPHIYGTRDADVAFGLAYAHAQDDWLNIQNSLAAPQAKMAQHKGIDGARIDYITYLMRIRPTVEARYETDLDPQTRVLVEGYAAGLNLYALEHEDEVWTDLLPIKGEDIIAGFVLRAPLMYGLGADIAELFADERKRFISLGGETSAFLSTDQPNVEMGSNAMAIAPIRSTDGATRLIVNSHQPFKGPVAWYEARLKSEQGWDAAGGVFPGSPIVLHGHNSHLAWAHTVNHPDLTDIYVLEINPENENQYLFEGEWRNFEISTAPIRVKIWGPFSWVVEREVLWSVHGPAIRRPHGTYAIRHTGQDEVRQVEQWFKMNKAKNLDEWMAAMKMTAISNLNTIYADETGNIAYIYNAHMPKRNAKYDWRSYLPGDREDALWQGFEPLENLPVYVNPPAGFLVNSNHSPFKATAEGDNLEEDNFPDSYGIEKHQTNRGLRSLELIGADDAISVDELLGYKFDNAYSEHSEVARLIAEISILNFEDNPLLGEAQTLLRDWNLQTTTDNPAVALGVLTALRCLKPFTQGEPWMMEPRQALKETAQDLMRHHNRLDVPWGEIMRLKRGDIDLPVNGGPDILRAIYTRGPELEDDGTLTAVAGDTYIMSVEWDKDGKLSSSAIHQFGSATLDPTSPHYADQAPLFAAQALRPIPLELDDLLQQATSDIRVGNATE